VSTRDAEKLRWRGRPAELWGLHFSEPLVDSSAHFPHPWGPGSCALASPSLSAPGQTGV
jgi:hypothetical protein